MAVKIFTMTHKKFDEPRDPIYVPLHVGKINANDLGYLGDDTGENISDMNCYYSELTGLYWIWKNFKSSDYVGLCHYRRYLINEQGSVFTESEFDAILKKYDIITSKRLQYDFTYFDGYEQAHNINDLIETGKVLKEKYPEYYVVYERLVHSNESYFGNIMVTSKELFDEYASWLFDIFFEVQKRIDVSSYDDYHKRVFGFISEFLLLVWVTVKNLKVYECMVGMTAEKQETKEMKVKLAEYFREKDVHGAKKYFVECINKRPDVLLEASDITGELKLSMQVISTCEFELQNYQNCVMEEINDFKELMTYFRKLNDIVKRYKINKNQIEDIEYLKNHKVSPTAIEIAVKILGTEEKSFDNIFQQMISDIKQYQM